MGASVQELKTILSGDSSGAEDAFKRATHGAGGLFSYVKQANQEARASGELAFEKLLKGGGAAAGVTMVAEGIGHAADAIKEFQAAARKGEQDYGAFVDKLAESVPIFGKVWEAGRKIHGLLFGDDAQDLKDAQERDQQIRESIAKQHEAQARRDLVTAEGDARAKLEVTRKYAKLDSDAVAERDKAAKAAADDAERETRERFRKAGAIEVPMASEENGVEVGGAGAAGVDVEGAVAKARAEAIARVNAASQKEREKDGETRRVEEGRIALAQMRAVEDAERQVADARSKARVEAFKADGNEFGAQREEINREYHQAGVAAAKAYAEGLKAHPENAAEMAKAYADVLEANDQVRGSRMHGVDRNVAKSIAESTVQQSEAGDDFVQEEMARASKREEVEREIARLRVDAAREAAQFGDAEQQRAAQVLEIREKERAKLLEIQKLANDKDLTAEQRKALMGLAGQEDRNAARAIAKLSAGGTASDDRAAATEAGFLTRFGPGSDGGGLASHMMPPPPPKPDRDTAGGATPEVLAQAIAEAIAKVTLKMDASVMKTPAVPGYSD